MNTTGIYLDAKVNSLRIVLSVSSFEKFRFHSKRNKEERKRNCSWFLSFSYSGCCFSYYFITLNSNTLYESLRFQNHYSTHFPFRVHWHKFWVNCNTSKTRDSLWIWTFYNNKTQQLLTISKWWRKRWKTVQKQFIENRVLRNEANEKDRIRIKRCWSSKLTLESLPILVISF